MNLIPGSKIEDYVRKIGSSTYYLISSEVRRYLNLEDKDQIVILIGGDDGRRYIAIWKK